MEALRDAITCRSYADPQRILNARHGAVMHAMGHWEKMAGPSQQDFPQEMTVRRRKCFVFGGFCLQGSGLGKILGDVPES